MLTNRSWHPISRDHTCPVSMDSCSVRGTIQSSHFGLLIVLCYRECLSSELIFCRNHLVLLGSSVPHSFVRPRIGGQCGRQMHAERPMLTALENVRASEPFAAIPVSCLQPQWYCWGFISDSVVCSRRQANKWSPLCRQEKWDRKWDPTWHCM